MIKSERNTRKEHLYNVACQMMTAARTAPKGKGVDIIEIALLADNDIENLACEMEKSFEKHGMKFFLRDAQNIRQADYIIIIGTKDMPQGLNCSYCGYSKCSEKPVDVPCAINTTDVGIAIGSAVATASDLRVDTRIMFSAGSVAAGMNIIPGCRTCYAIPISASSKNPFFDRKRKEENK